MQMFLRVVTAESDLQLYKASSLLHLNPRVDAFAEPLAVDDDKYKIVFSQSKHMSWPRVTGRALKSA